jgi:hypothetical protein
MSKMDALRAMREARYEEMTKRAGDKPATRATPATPKKRPPVAPPAADTAQPAEGLCGHKNMSGRTCTREKGHAAKSHRYS